MVQKVAVITGASAGVGKAAAATLAEDGWRVIGIGRDPSRSKAAALEIADVATDPANVTMLQGDLASLADVRRLAGEIAGLTDRIDLLANNAGGMASEKRITSEGLEANFAGNHLGPFLLTNLLVPLLRKAAADGPAGSVRIVNTSSDASEMIADLPWDDLARFDKAEGAGRIYSPGKLANVLHAKALASRLAADGIVAHAYHPGTVDSNFVTHASPQTQAYINGLEKVSSAEGADTLLWLATAEEPGESSGGYWYKRAHREPNPLVHDPAAVERLWAESERLTG